MSRRAGMFGSEAGLVRIEKVILTTSAASADSGPTCLEAKDWRNWTFTVEGIGPFSVLWFGTNDINTAGTLPGTATPPGSYGGAVAVAATASNWFKIPALAAQSGTGVEANPTTDPTQSLSYDKPLRAVRAVVSGNTPGNVVSCKVAAAP